MDFMADYRTLFEGFATFDFHQWLHCSCLVSYLLFWNSAMNFSCFSDYEELLSLCDHKCCNTIHPALHLQELREIYKLDPLLKNDAAYFWDYYIRISWTFLVRLLFYHDQMSDSIHHHRLCFTLRVRVDVSCLLALEAHLTFSPGQSSKSRNDPHYLEGNWRCKL